MIRKNTNQLLNNITEILFFVFLFILYFLIVSILKHLGKIQKKSKIWEYEADQIVDFIRNNISGYKEYFNKVSVKGNFRYCEEIYETKNFIIKVSSNDDDFRTNISVIRKTDNKYITGLSG